MCVCVAGQLYEIVLTYILCMYRTCLIGLFSFSHSLRPLFPFQIQSNTRLGILVYHFVFVYGWHCLIMTHACMRFFETHFNIPTVAGINGRFTSPSSLSITMSHSFMDHHTLTNTYTHTHTQFIYFKFRV